MYVTNSIDLNAIFLSSCDRSDNDTNYSIRAEGRSTSRLQSATRQSLPKENPLDVFVVHHHISYADKNEMVVLASFTRLTHLYVHSRTRSRSRLKRRRRGKNVSVAYARLAVSSRGNTRRVLPPGRTENTPAADGEDLARWSSQAAAEHVAFGRGGGDRAGA